MRHSFLKPHVERARVHESRVACWICANELRALVEIGHDGDARKRLAILVSSDRAERDAVRELVHAAQLDGERAIEKETPPRTGRGVGVDEQLAGSAEIVFVGVEPAVGRRAVGLARRRIEHQREALHRRLRVEDETFEPGVAFDGVVRQQIAIGAEARRQPVVDGQQHVAAVGFWTPVDDRERRVAGNRRARIDKVEQVAHVPRDAGNASADARSQLDIDAGNHFVGRRPAE